jgi:hypothetical protein
MEDPRISTRAAVATEADMEVRRSSHMVDPVDLGDTRLSRRDGIRGLNLRVGTRDHSPKEAGSKVHHRRSRVGGSKDLHSSREVGSKDRRRRSRVDGSRDRLRGRRREGILARDIRDREAGIRARVIVAGIKG